MRLGKLHGYGLIALVSLAPIVTFAGEGDRSPSAATDSKAELAPGAPSAPAPTTEVAPAPVGGGLSTNGIIDLYFAHNFNRPLAVAAPGAGYQRLPVAQNQFHDFDLYSDQIGLSLLELSVIKTISPQVKFQIDLDFGQTADFTHLSSGGIDEVSKHVGQAFASYTPATVPNLTIKAGKFATHLGWEVIKSRDNWNYSRSILFGYAIPFWHTGLAATYADVMPHVTVAGYLYNGWNSIYDTNDAKTLGATLSWAPNSIYSLTYNVISGAEQAGNNDHRRSVHEFLLNVNATSSLAFALDAVLGKSAQEPFGGALVDATWTAAELGAKYTFAGGSYVAVRGEIFNDADGVATAAVQKLNEESVTWGIPVAPGLETRLELRRDASNVDSFSSRTGVKSTQTSAIVGAIFSF